jgi:hypothetical protein
MSDPSKIPPGNRPPAGRVVRPFAGGSAEQGSPSPSPDSRVTERRPVQPRRPFVGGQAAPSNAAAPPPAIDNSPAIDVSPDIDFSTAVDVSPAVDVSTPTDIDSSAPATEAPDATVVERATWLTIVEAEPAVLDFGTDLIGENATLGDEFEMGETSTLPLELPAIAKETVAPSFEEPILPAPERLPVVTADVLAIDSEEIDHSPIPEYVEPVPEHVQPDLLDAPLFIAPSSEPDADSVIDEVDAAFITAGLPSTGDGSPSDDALRAAAALEEVARRLRAGDIDLQRSPTANMSSEESALATVLAALLANR